VAPDPGVAAPKGAPRVGSPPTSPSVSTPSSSPAPSAAVDAARNAASRDAQRNAPAVEGSARRAEAAGPAARRNAAKNPAAVEDGVPPLPEVGRATKPPVASTDEPEVRVPAPAVDTGPLVLTATALDTCALRLQVDADARRAQRFTFTQRGESRSWTARQSFRVVVSRSNHLELRLNGRLVPVPADGRTVVFDRGALGPTPASRRRQGRN
jgi:hypothetical protein